LSKLSHEPMLEMFIFETAQLLEQLEQVIINSEKISSYTEHNINEVFRIMHTIKGSSAMMLFNSIASLAHSMEDLFYFIRENKPQKIDFTELTDLILEGADFIQTELVEIENGREATADSCLLIEKIKVFLGDLKKINQISDQSCKNNEKAETIKQQQYYIGSDSFAPIPAKKMFKAVVYFEEGCQMENVRAFTVLHNLKDLVSNLHYFPSNIVEDDSTEEIIRVDGFKVFFSTEYSLEIIREILMDTIFLKHLELEELVGAEELIEFEKNQQAKLRETQSPEIKMIEREQDLEAHSKSLNQSIISVSVSKLDTLMDLVGEMVIAEAMVVQNPDLRGLELDNFQKAARQLNKITSEMQDMVMSIRMVPLSATFHKMHRITRDMCKKLDKEVKLEIIGEETEVDKNIIEHISDPLMHLVRNALDHGIEPTEDRLAKGKPKSGTITIEAKNAGSDVLIIIKDDGKGLDRDGILKRAKENDLLYRSEEDMSDGEVFNLILLPGFSTKESVSEFSGRGVGMDVVSKNIETIGGSVSVDSVQDGGTTITLKIPLTLAIIDGMNIKVGKSRYTIPTASIKESFRPEENDIITDPQGNEMIMVRGECYPILRLHELYNVETKITNFIEGIIIMVEQDTKNLCVFADELLGQQQVVVKTLPDYIRQLKTVKGLAGCTLLGDGSISLILDAGGLFNL